MTKPGTPPVSYPEGVSAMATDIKLTPAQKKLLRDIANGEVWYGQHTGAYGARWTRGQHSGTRNIAPQVQTLQAKGLVARFPLSRLMGGPFTARATLTADGYSLLATLPGKD